MPLLSQVPETNPSTGELFLRLRHHRNIIITPHRLEDAPLMVPLFNDPRIYHWLLRPPFPYVLSHAEGWLKSCIPQEKSYIDEFKLSQSSQTPAILSGCPFSALREVKDDGSDEFIGNITLKRCNFCEFLNTDTIDFENAQKNTAANDALEVGDSNIVWGIGDYLRPSHHGRGIMSDAVETLIHDWGVPRMNTRRYLVTPFTGNHGSVKVFQKNGFTLTRTIAEYGVVRGEMRGMHVLEWTAEAS
ncbi:hypothetical protein D9619_002817 [Psilocybe cf. subviscida]|uniref:N-acetyltransferase domain-containing protein n=1 Tax=Psilocybe cf. subviscida TaxID=2480587 RepID=A0A8H5EUA6_9AGAR|nr:hypothetical protein D9619_002817 [Psilocybe cf. subviscida]